MSLPILNSFKIPNNTYQQTQFYPVYLVYLNYAKNYNSNLLQFSTSLYQTSISNYINTSNSYISNLLKKAPVPQTPPWNIILPIVSPPTPPATIGWTQSQIDIVNAINSCNVACYNATDEWINFVKFPPPVPVQITDRQAQEISGSSANLLIRQYAGADRAWKTIAFINYYFLLNNKVVFDLQKAYNIWSSVGAQLDAIGNFYGVKRNISFSDGTTNWNTLTDSQYRIYLCFLIISSTCTFTYADMARIMQAMFKGQVKVSSSQDMMLTYNIIASKDSDMYVAIVALISTKKLPSPCGVNPKYVLVNSNPKQFFALPCTPEEQAVSTYEKYGWATNYDNMLDYRMLSTGDFVITS